MVARALKYSNSKAFIDIPTILNEWSLAIEEV